MRVPDWANINLWCRKFSARVVRSPHIPGVILFYAIGFLTLFSLASVADLIFAPVGVAFNILMTVWVGWFVWQMNGKRDYKNLTEYRHGWSATVHVNDAPVTVTVSTAEPIKFDIALVPFSDGDVDDNVDAEICSWEVKL